MSSDLLRLDNSNDLGVVTLIAESDPLVAEARGVVEVAGTVPADNSAALSTMMLPLELGEFPLTFLAILDKVIRNPVGHLVLLLTGSLGKLVFESSESRPVVSLVVRVWGLSHISTDALVTVIMPIRSNYHPSSLFRIREDPIFCPIVGGLLDTDAEGPVYLTGKFIDLVQLALISVK